MKVFIPCYDDLDQCPPSDRLVPYRVGLCLWSQVTIEPQERGVAPRRERVMTQPAGKTACGGTGARSVDRP